MPSKIARQADVLRPVAAAARLLTDELLVTKSSYPSVNLRPSLRGLPQAGSDPPKVLKSESSLGATKAGNRAALIASRDQSPQTSLKPPEPLTL